jgi:hypothetical protein
VFALIIFFTPPAAAFIIRCHHPLRVRYASAAGVRGARQRQQAGSSSAAEAVREARGARTAVRQAYAQAFHRSSSFISSDFYAARCLTPRRCHFHYFAMPTPLYFSPDTTIFLTMRLPRFISPAVFADISRAERYAAGRAGAA